MSQSTFSSLSYDRILVAPSLLAADFSRLGDEVNATESGGADFFHLDIMDGHFVPNLSMGPAVVSAIRPCTKLVFDVHLMVSRPAQFIAPFVAAGADHITFHIEAEDDVARTIDAIHDTGCSVGLSLKPDTNPDCLRPYLDKVDLILVMTVEPGFGGQSFRHDMQPKIATIAGWLQEANLPVHLEVDGGIDRFTAPLASRAGAKLMVAGTSIFKSPHGYPAAIAELRHQS